MLARHLLAWIGLVLAAQPACADGPLLEVVHRYNGVGRSVPIHVAEMPDAGGDQMLLLMDPSGWLDADPVPVGGGMYDLAELFPQIWALQQTAYVQLRRGNVSVGSALVVQPLLSRLVPVVEEPDPAQPARQQKIIEWVDENAKPARGDAEVEDETDVVMTPADTPRLLSGLRIYAERDVVIRTTHGDITMAMRPDQAPQTVWNFLELAGGGFYRDVIFHRIIPVSRDGDPFVIQAGDPTATGEGGPGYWLPIEPSRLAHDFGVMSMARGPDPDSGGSQIFICLSRAGTARLDGQYCAFAYAIDGAETIMSIAAVELADVGAGRPVDPPRINGMELVAAPPRIAGVGRPDERVAAPRVAPGDKPREQRVPR